MIDEGLKLAFISDPRLKTAFAVDHKNLDLPKISPHIRLAFSCLGESSPFYESFTITCTIVTLSLQNNSGRFWNIDQKSNLFPADIAEDSPYKQETATSVLCPEDESRTQDAISAYFSQSQKDLTSPADPSLSSNTSRVQHIANSTSIRAFFAIGEGNSSSQPGNSNNAGSSGAAMDTSNSNEANLSTASSSSAAGANCSAGSASQPASAGTSAAVHVSQWCQTELTFPSTLPAAFEEQLKAYFTFNERQDDQAKPKVIKSASTGHLPGMTRQRSTEDAQNNLSTSRRKLFGDEDGLLSDEDEEGKGKNALDPLSHWMSSPVKEVRSMDEDEKENFLSPQPIPLTPIRGEGPGSANRPPFLRSVSEY